MNQEQQSHRNGTVVAPHSEEFLLEMRIREAIDRLTTLEAKRHAIATLKEAVHALELELEKDDA